MSTFTFNYMDIGPSEKHGLPLFHTQHDARAKIEATAILGLPAYGSSISSDNVAWR